MEGIGRPLVVGLALGLLLAGCSSEDQGDHDDVVALTTTTAAPTTSTTELTPIRPFPSVTAPLPTPGAELADGVHAVVVRGTSDSDVTVDVVQFLTGPEADDAYAEETGDSEGVPNDYYVRNTTEDVRTLAVSDDLVVTFAHGDDGIGEYPGALEEVGSHTSRYFNVLYWITVEDGIVIRLDEQYTP